ncbi:hypothetical protein EVAR_5547_1 [Eumeta japonica]|uniref:Uncharacterized protein n=1 Tax=Eumeta variegata TaxID=151549 RepID=A0A4C1U1Q2_EUMVA|nr:hypothetical protein EVAR_5547_1 [Eumeta japonica]
MQTGRSYETQFYRRSKTKCFEGNSEITYHSCLQPLDVCRDHICLGEENCMMYVPPHCPGCEPVPVCV